MSVTEVQLSWLHSSVSTCGSPPARILNFCPPPQDTEQLVHDDQGPGASLMLTTTNVGNRINLHKFNILLRGSNAKYLVSFIMFYQLLKQTAVHYLLDQDKRLGGPCHKKT